MTGRGGHHQVAVSSVFARTRRAPALRWWAIGIAGTIIGTAMVVSGWPREGPGER